MPEYFHVGTTYLPDNTTAEQFIYFNGALTKFYVVENDVIYWLATSRVIYRDELFNMTGRELLTI